MLSASLALAQNVTITTTNGKQYKNATISRVEPDGVSVKFSGGLVKIPFTELPKDLQQKYNYDPEKAAAAQAAEMAVIGQTNQQVEESNKQQKEVEQQKALENQLSQLQQQEENLRAQIGGVNNSARETRYGNVHERSKLGLEDIAAGGGVHATNAQSALRV
jgi:TolA-binding protein